MNDLLTELAGLSVGDPAVADETTRCRMTELTDQVALIRNGAESEYQRFLDVQRRELPAGLEQAAERVAGATVLVTGGTGCIGSEVLRAVLRCRPQRLVSVSRGLTVPRQSYRWVEYRRGDVRDDVAMGRLLRDVRPDIVFHLAAVRDPGEAQRFAPEAVTTNLLGTQTVLEVARDTGVANVVYASSGKAVRYYTRDVYAATKKVGEAVVADASSHMGVGMARFTHVVDNSLIHGLLRQWMRESFLRLHHTHLAMYAQSAVEAAQLLLLGCTAKPGRPMMYSLRDLGYFFELIDIALGMRRRAGSSAALWFTGLPEGYESQPHPAQYDPQLLGETGPLINAIEAPVAETVAGGVVNGVAIRVHGRSTIRNHLVELARATRRPWSRPEFMHQLDAAGIELMDETFAGVGPAALQRLLRLGDTRGRGTAEQRVIDEALRRARRHLDAPVCQAV